MYHYQKKIRFFAGILSALFLLGGCGMKAGSVSDQTEKEQAAISDEQTDLPENPPGEQTEPVSFIDAKGQTCYHNAIMSEFDAVYDREQGYIYDD